MKLLIINPGSTSTKLALYDGAKKLLQENLEHDAAALQQYHGIGDQVPMRLAVIRDFLDRSGVHPEELAAVIGRGGLVFGLKTGGYLVNEDLCHALVDDDLSQPHASNLGGLLAREIAAPLGIPAYIYDAVTSGELTDVAKITGFVDIERRSFCHVLNSRAMALRYAREHGKHYEELNLIVAHLGGGISASVHRHGEIIDSVGDDDGQFSPERSGCVPSLGLIKLCYSYAVLISFDMLRNYIHSYLTQIKIGSDTCCSSYAGSYQDILYHLSCKLMRSQIICVKICPHIYKHLINRIYMYILRCNILKIYVVYHC